MSKIIAIQQISNREKNQCSRIKKQMPETQLEVVTPKQQTGKQQNNRRAKELKNIEKVEHIQQTDMLFLRDDAEEQNIQKIKKYRDNNLNTLVQKLDMKKQEKSKIKHNETQYKRRVILQLPKLMGKTIDVKSNIFNISVGDLLVEENSENKLIDQIAQLRIKLEQLKLKKQHKELLNINKQKQQQINQNILFKSEENDKNQNIELNRGYKSKLSKTRCSKNLRKSVCGRIYNPQQSNKLKIMNTDKHSTLYKWHPKYEQASPGVFYHKQEKYKIKKNKKPLTANLPNNNKSNSTQKSEQFYNVNKLNSNREEKICSKDQPSNQIMKNNFDPNFRKNAIAEIDFHELPVGPSALDSQADLIILAKIVFNIFGVSIQREQTQNNNCKLEVHKYKNCVHFILDVNKNIVWYFNGNFYFGGWIMGMTGQWEKEGDGVQYIPNVYVYRGQFSDGKRSGSGTMQHYRFLQSKDGRKEKKGVIYQGQWNFGQKSGYGYQIDENDEEYIGEWKQNFQNGKGCWRNGEQYYEGDFINNVKNGKGTELFKNGDKYVGEYTDGLFNGNGTYIWKSGAKFIGKFSAGIKNGKGIWKSGQSNYDFYEGQYSNGMKQGLGLYQWNNGSQYEGYFKEDKKHGQGILRYANGKVAKFMWKQGQSIFRLYCPEEEKYRNRKKSNIQNQVLSNSQVQWMDTEEIRQQMQSSQLYNLNRESNFHKTSAF